MVIKETLKKDSEALDWTDTNSFILSYGHFINFFNKPESITESDFIIGAHFTYGWMPTILDFRPKELKECVAILNKVKNKQDITDKDFNKLINAINGSLVGVSKLLHFIDPQKYAIWDSNVIEYLKLNEGGKWGVKDIEAYKSYLGILEDVSRDDGTMKIIRKNIGSNFIGTVSDLRIIEMVMFLKGRKIQQELKRKKAKKKKPT